MDYFYPLIGITLNVILLCIVCVCYKRCKSSAYNQNQQNNFQEPFLITHHYAIPIQFYPQQQLVIPGFKESSLCDKGTIPPELVPPKQLTMPNIPLTQNTNNELYTIYENDDQGNPVNQ